MGVIKNVLVIILICVAIFFGIRLLTPEDNWVCKGGIWQQHGKPSTPMPNTPCKKESDSIIPTSTPSLKDSKQNEYKNIKMGFGVSLPVDFETSENIDGTVSFTKWGPTQKAATELFDGISINIDQGTLGQNKDLKSLIEADIVQKKEQLSPDFKIIKNIVQTDNGYYYQSQEMFGNVEYYYLSQSDNKFLLISVIQKDPGNLGFDKIVTEIISDIKMTK